MYREPINSVNQKEKEAVLALTKHFKDFWTVVDVGSNKGNWTDILLNEREPSKDWEKIEVYLFEPNKLLLDYCRVKYEHTDKIKFFNEALGSKIETKEFYYFENNHSGISNFLGNWKDLHPKKEYIDISTLDSRYFPNDIDIIKIDVEGLELEVLKGAEKLIREKRVKFFQVECSPHNPNVKFEDIVQYLGQFGYKCWDYKDGEFVEVSTFQQQLIDNFYFTYIPIGKYYYTQLWNSEFIKNTQFLKKKVEFAIELGAYEGLTSNYICDNLLVEGARMIAVDPLEDYYLEEGSDNTTNQMFVGQYERFIRNTVHQPIELIRKKSQDIEEDIKNYWFDFCFIDADHRPDSVYKDAVLMFPRIKLDGYILFDDYNWSHNNLHTKDGINKFLEEYKEKCVIIVQNEQVLIQKTKHVD